MIITMDLSEARRILAVLGVPDLDAHLAAGWQSLETGPSWAIEEDLVKMPPQRREFADEDALARFLVLRQLNSSPPPIPDHPAPARPWSVAREIPTASQGLYWSTTLVTGSTFAMADPETIVVRDVSAWWDHQLAGAVVIRTIDLATGEQQRTYLDNGKFALGTVTGKQIPLPRWARKSVPPAQSGNPRQDLAVMVRSAPPQAGERESRFVAVRLDDIRHPADGFRLEIWGSRTSR